MSLVQNHPPDLTTSPGCSFPPTLVAVKPSTILPHPLLPSPSPGREAYVVVQVHLLHVFSSWH